MSLAHALRAAAENLRRSLTHIAPLDVDNIDLEMYTKSELAEALAVRERAIAKAWEVLTEQLEPIVKAL